MGVVNVTPDSFSDGGRFGDGESAAAHGCRLVDEGADLVDIGGESTRPGAAPVPAHVQAERILPVVRALRERTDAIISVDTTSAHVAEQALLAGASLVNDISGFRFDEGMLPLLARTGVPAIAMHTLDAPIRMQDDPHYDDVVEDVLAHLADRLDACDEAGVDTSQIILDPGIGFGKTLEHNLLLLRGLPRLVALGRPVVVGTSLKSFLGQLTGKSVEDRQAATNASCAVAVALGAHMVRVHDVAAVRDAVTVAGAIARGAPFTR